jgi:lipopolysaccharide/colanic/teichoic acid biosynthesis glycosyltransferase
MSLFDPDFLSADSKLLRRARPTLPRRGNILANLRATARPKMKQAPLASAQILSFPVPAEPAPAEAPVVIPPSRPSLYRDGLKRAFDIVTVLASAVFWLPIIMVAALLITLRDGHSPFYTQDRVGRGGRIFRMIKLRSMVPDAHEKLEAYLATDPEARAEWDATQKLKRDPRITTVGRIIRKTSIDELPQLFNVLWGDMSVVGPRPFMVDQQTLYHGRRYYDLRPGLTGFWQISDRNECNFAQRAHFDTAYYRAVSLKTDLTVIARTVGVVLRGTGY